MKLISEINKSYDVTIFLVFGYVSEILEFEKSNKKLMFSWTLGFFTLGESRKSFMFFEVRSGNAIPNSYYCIRETENEREREA